MYATSVAFIEVSAPQKITVKIIKHEIFCGSGFYKRREKNYKENKKKKRKEREGEEGEKLRENPIKNK